ncbi:XRE family transcriptional regulator [Streptomyces hygroscopicus]|uniref:XRE family transcriptional regulator n=1 Tax=Streptomyces hygroscopicus TaxID=1912 RepID=UPI0036B4E400
MPNLQRKGDGQPLRDAMEAAGLSGPALSAATKEVDVTGKGVSPATVGKVAGKGKTANGRPRLRTAWLMAVAVNKPLQDLFDMPGVSMSTDSTSTDERSTDGDDEDAR